MKPLRTLLLVVCLALAACSHVPYTVVKKGEIDAQIEATRRQTTEQLVSLAARESALLGSKVAAIEGQRQAAADALFKGLVTGSGLKSPTRPEMVMNQSIQKTAIELPPASPAAQIAGLTELQRELDEALVSKEELRAQYEMELGKAKAEGAARAAAVTELDTKLKAEQAAKETILAEALAKEQALQAAKDTVQDKELALQVAKTETAKQDAERAKSVQAIKVKMSAITGGLALLCLAGAIWSPAFKSKFGLGAAILGVVTAGIWYVQPWHLGLVVGLGVLALVAWAAKNHYTESRAARNTYLAVQAIKDRSREAYDSIVKPVLTEYQTRYDKTGKPIPDEAAIAHVDSVLRERDAI